MQNKLMLILSLAIFTTLFSKIAVADILGDHTFHVKELSTKEGCVPQYYPLSCDCTKSFIKLISTAQCQSSCDYHTSNICDLVTVSDIPPSVAFYPVTNPTTNIGCWQSNGITNCYFNNYSIWTALLGSKGGEGYCSNTCSAASWITPSISIISKPDFTIPNENLDEDYLLYYECDPENENCQERVVHEYSAWVFFKQTSFSVEITADDSVCLWIWDEDSAQNPIGETALGHYCDTEGGLNEDPPTTQQFNIELPRSGWYFIKIFHYNNEYASLAKIKINNLHTNVGALSSGRWDINADENQEICMGLGYYWNSNAQDPDRMCCGDDPDDIGYYYMPSDVYDKSYCSEDGWINLTQACIENNGNIPGFNCGDYAEEVCTDEDLFQGDWLSFAESPNINFEQENPCCGDDENPIFNATFDSEEQLSELIQDDNLDHRFSTYFVTPFKTLEINLFNFPLTGTAEPSRCSDLDHVLCADFGFTCISLYPQGWCNPPPESGSSLNCDDALDYCIHTLGKSMQDCINEVSSVPWCDWVPEYRTINTINFSTVPGIQYKLEADVNIPDMPDHNVNGAFFALSLEFRNLSGAKLGYPIRLEQPTNGWLHISRLITAPPNTYKARIRIIFYNFTNATRQGDYIVEVDNISLTAIPGVDYGFISSDNQALCNYVDDSWSWFYADQDKFKIFNFPEVSVDVASNGDEWFVCDATGRGLLRGEHLSDLDVLPGVEGTPEMQGCLNLSGCCVDVDDSQECISFSGSQGNFASGGCLYTFNENPITSSEICSCIGGVENTCDQIFGEYADTLQQCLEGLGLEFYCFGTPSGGAQGGEEQLPLSQCQGLNVVSCLEGLAQFSCYDVNGVVCDEGEVCTGFNFSDANHDNCCLDGLCITPPSNTEECIDSGFNVCSQGQFCDGAYYNMSEGGYCCFGQCVDIPNIVPKANKIICFKNDGKDAFAECCADGSSIEETCYNYNNLGSLDSLVFPQGTSFYSLNSFDYKKNGLLVSGVRKISIPSYTIPTTNHDITGFKAITFSFAANEGLSNFTISLMVGGSWHKLASGLTLANFSTTGSVAFRWHRIVIPLENFEDLHPGTTITVVLFNHTTDSSFTALIDNLELIPNTLSGLVSYERFCTGHNWISDYDNSSFGKFACDAVAGFGWTGHYCCGDDTTVNADEKEFFNDSIAGCWGGVFVPENILVGYALNDDSLNDILFFDNQFWVCDPESSKSNVYPYNVTVWFDNDNSGGRLIPNGVDSNNFVPAFTVKGRWFCSFDGVWKPLESFPGYRALVAYMLNLSLSNSGDNFTLYCDDEGFALNQLPEGFEGLFNSSVCVASFKNNNKHRLVIGGVVGNVSKFIEAVNSYFGGVGVPLDACSGAPKLFQPDTFFYVCDASGDSDTNVSLLFNRYTGVVVLNYYTNQGEQGFLSGFRAFVKKAWDDLVNAIADLFIGGGNPNVGIPVSDARFDKVFIANRPGDKYVRVVLENVSDNYVLVGEFENFPEDDVRRLADIIGAEAVCNTPQLGDNVCRINRSSSEPFDDFWNFATGSLRIS